MKLSEFAKEKPDEAVGQDEPVKVVPLPQEQIETPQQEPVNENLIKISESAIYRKYFKMLKVGIPTPAVKQKMSSEGLVASLLDNSELMIEKTEEDFEEQ